MTAKSPRIMFTPLQGVMSLGQMVAARFGLGELWAGDDGFEGVLREKLTEMGLPAKPIALSGPQGITVRQMAEQSGFIKRKRRQRRVK